MDCLKCWNLMIIYVDTRVFLHSVFIQINLSRNVWKKLNKKLGRNAGRNNDWFVCNIRIFSYFDRYSNAYHIIILKESDTLGWIWIYYVYHEDTTSTCVCILLIPNNLVLLMKRFNFIKICHKLYKNIHLQTQ